MQAMQKRERMVCSGNYIVHCDWKAGPNGLSINNTGKTCKDQFIMGLFLTCLFLVIAFSGDDLHFY